MDLAQTKALLAQYDIRPTRSLGQNFLVDDRVVARICTLANLQPTDLVIEIGPGIGHLTRSLSQLAGRVITIEIDRHVLPALTAVMAGQANFTLIHADALQVAFADLTAGWPGPVKVIANLPYYITTPLITKIVREIPSFTRLVFMVQLEAAQRLLAQPGSKDYGPLGVLLHCLGSVRRAMNVSAAAFWPRPHVDSAVIEIEPRPSPVAVADWDAFIRFVEACFQQRRKTLANSLRHDWMHDTGRVEPQPLVTHLAALGLSDRIRAEAMTPTQFVQLYYAIAGRESPDRH